jgi:hypothetical protein
MTITAEQLQVAGITVIVLIGLGFLGWVVRAAIRMHGGNPVYMLPDDSDDDAPGADDDDADGSHGDPH